MPEPAYVWSVEGADVRVELEREAAVKLRAAVKAAGPDEIGGFLLGTAQDGVTRIIGFQLVEIEHRRGEAYDLTPLDRLRFSRRCAPWLNKRPKEIRAVGFFRTHVRPGLFLDEHDFRTVQEFFADPSQVVMLVRPEPQGSAVAGFFFWEGGDMERRKSFRPFPLDDAIYEATERPAAAVAAAAVAAEVAPVVASAVEAPVIASAAAPVAAETVEAEQVAVAPVREPVAEAAVDAARPSVMVPVMQPRERRDRDVAEVKPERRDNRDSWKYGLIAACIPLVAGLAYFAGRHEAHPSTVMASRPAASVPTQAADHAAYATAPPVAAVTPETTPLPEQKLGLPDQKTGEQNASGNLSRGPVVAHLPTPVKPSAMDAPRLSARERRLREAEDEPDWAAGLTRKPAVISKPAQVVYTREQSSASAHAAGAANSQQANAMPAPPRQESSSPAGNAAAESARLSDSGRQEVARLESRAEEARTAPEPSIPAEAPERPRFRPELHPAITVEWAEPSSGFGSRLVRLPKKILTLGLAGDNFTPPRPLHEVAPTVPLYVAKGLTEAVPVTVRLSVDTAGRVRATELVSKVANPELANLAMNAALKWEFIAARQNDTPVPSYVVARFRFRPPQP